jgi:hypothetical protein
MAESRSWAIITALATQLATITVANGYNTDVGNNVWTTDAQRPSEDALGLMIYSESITGGGIDSALPGKPVREFTLLIEAAIGTDQDTAQQQIHNVIEDVETCMKAYAKAQAMRPELKQVTPMAVVDIAILDRPEGAAVIAMQARVVARYFR